jgi:hypothetical protein
MHKRLTFHGDGSALGSLAREIEDLDGVIALSRVAGGALKPLGDVLQADVLNRSADEVLRRARPRLEDPARKVSLVISETTAIVDRERAALVETDADESLWEEMESDLRNHGRISTNYVLLMALGGSIAAAGLLFDPVPQAIALVGASIIAPGFEPVAKLAQSLALGRMQVCGRALLSLVVGYAVLGAAAFAVTLLASLVHPGAPRAAVTAEPTLRALAQLDAVPILVSACAAVAGVLMVVSLRDLYVVGPLMVLVLISGVALVGASLAAGEPRVALGALARAGVDLVVVIVLGALVFTWKQRLFHRRRPLP